MVAIFFRIGRFGMVISNVPSWVPKMGSRSFPSSWKFGSFAHTFIANSNCRTRLAHPTKAAIPRSMPSSGAPSGSGGPYVPPRRTPVHVHCCIARVHAAYVCTERAAITVRVHLCVIEIVVALIIGTKLGVIFIRRKDAWSAAAPAPSVWQRLIPAVPGFRHAVAGNREMRPHVLAS